jgi:hypothetical protein
MRRKSSAAPASMTVSIGRSSRANTKAPSARKWRMPAEGYDSADVPAMVDGDDRTGKTRDARWTFDAN